MRIGSINNNSPSFGYDEHLNIQQNNNMKFKGTAAIRDTFVSRTNKKREPENTKFGEKFSNLKQYNADLITKVEIARLDKEDYDAILSEIKSKPQRQQALREGKTKLSFKRDEEKYFENFDEQKCEFSFSESLGFSSFTRLKTKKGANKVDVRRKEEVTNEHNSREIKDTSSFNQKYSIKNRFEEFNGLGENPAKGVSREISIATVGGKPILKYNYARAALTGSKLSKTIINGREYLTQTTNDGKVFIKSGTKGSRMDFLSRLDTDSIRTKGGIPSIEDARVEARKINFVQALKTLPPQILCQMDDDFDTFKDGKGKIDGRTLEVNLYCPETAAESMLMGTIENVATNKGLTEDKELKKIFKEEWKNYVDWLSSPKENCLIMSEEYYLKKLKDPETDLMKTIKTVCKLLWTEEYDKGRVNDENMRLLLNFFPKSVSYIVSTFELNNI